MPVERSSGNFNPRRDPRPGTALIGRVPAARHDADSVASRIPRCRHAGAVLPEQRGSVGVGAARCGGGRRE